MFYWQQRVGEKGRIYGIYKIRTRECASEATTGPVWSPRQDPRITRVGWFLRATHLDELPQLWNVVRGEMSLIGPRPERPELIPEIERQIPGYRRRMQIRPGLTGMAQIHLFSDTRIEHVRRKLVYDLYYVRYMSPWLDARILICTGFYLIAALANTQCKLVMLPDRNPTQREIAAEGSADFDDDDDVLERPWTA
jgi:lipopolysaccharide/colanic/teichoic acid biosynthesis glycosyltransferase